jgi:hypothetical protein
MTLQASFREQIVSYRAAKPPTSHRIPILKVLRLNRSHSDCQKASEATPGSRVDGRSSKRKCGLSGRVRGVVRRFDPSQGLWKIGYNKCTGSGPSHCEAIGNETFV